MELFLGRHGKTNLNDKGVVQGKMDPEINEKGRVQAKKLKNRVVKQDFSKIYSSSSSRAIQTAKIISESLDIEIEVTEKLNEATRKQYEGEKVQDLIAEIEKSDTPDYLWKTENGENLKEVQNRSMKLLRDIKENHKGQKVVAITHAETIRCILLGIMKHEPKNIYKIKQQNCNINRIRCESDEGWSIHSVNDTSHLN